MPCVPLVPENHTHVLAEFDCLDPLLAALRLDSGRLKCTCLAVSRKWLALGTSAGGLHLIQREGWKQRLILTHKEGSITQVVCCPHDEDFIAIATSQGLVVVWELQLERRGRPERVSVSWEHRGQAITALCWETNALRVFVGDTAGKVSFLRAGSSKTGKGSAFVMFPVQTVTNVDSKVVQLGFQDGRLLVSSLSRCYICDTEKEKFWRVGNKERDGEYGACFFPQSRGLSLGQPPLLYCARPGSRVWEANFNGEVVSTHQFKQLLSCPPLPLITNRNEPQYNALQRSPQSLAFAKLLYMGDQNLLTWTDSAVFIFTPQNGQVLLWTEVKDVAEIVVYRSELFCLHGSGRLSHFTLLSAERCVERLLRRESWLLAAVVCCMFQHAITTSRSRKCIPIDRLEHLKSQLSPATAAELIGQLEEVINKLEPLDSASSSRRSSISSHESFNVLDCGIYRVISRRGSQSEEETGSLINQSTSEEERLKDFSFVPEEDHVDHDPQYSERLEVERSEQGLPFNIPLSFRPKPPRIALQAVKESVSSFMKKTTEKINTLQMNSELWQRPEFRDGPVVDMPAPTATDLDKMENVYDEMSSTEADLNELQTATDHAIAQIQDPYVLLDPVSLEETLLEWLPALEKVLSPVTFELTISGSESNGSIPIDDGGNLKRFRDHSSLLHSSSDHGEEDSHCESELEPDHEEIDDNVSKGFHVEPIRVTPPKPVPSELQVNLNQLAMLYLEHSCFRKHQTKYTVSCGTFLRRYFHLLDPERVRRMCLLCHRDQPEVHSSFIEGMHELTQSSKVADVIQRGDLQRSLRSLRELQPCTASALLPHLYRLYEKHGEAAVRTLSQFYPTITPADVTIMADQRHFLPYLDNLVQSRAEDHRLSFLQSLLDPESLRQDWLELALSNDAPLLCDTLAPSGDPRWHSHCFSWGYGRLLSLLIRLPADHSSKQAMADSCRNHGYWMGYLYLCNQLQRRSEAFSTICQLDDIGLLEGPEGVEPQTLDEWKLLIQMSQQSSVSFEHVPGLNGGGWSDNSGASAGKVTPETLMLMLARSTGPDVALDVLEECGVQLVLSPHSKLICELLRVTEKRQRAIIQTMLERCDRFLWSQHA
ncbi:Hermansky-Pudlak syndrome 5 protein isoform X2 [Eucyclogobius newberryi]|uniref:Hermansky-Pudlak syndrome 5 protein isoform X2 n=1 Tax=Eucyclogobius newberryi TaxID=166745 RepID=UPI003B5BB5D8